jgi:hypothetical protein
MHRRFGLCALLIGADIAAAEVEKLAVYEHVVPRTSESANPYLSTAPFATVTEPDGKTRRTVPLFWDGGKVWKFRVSPGKVGKWTWEVDGQKGSFTVIESTGRGSIRPMRGFPHHFERQDGSRLWFMGDTAWALVLDKAEESLNAEAVRRYVDARASQGFNVLHLSLLSEAGWGNSGGPPFEDVAQERINPAYWQEVDRRLTYANGQGFVVGVTLAWGDKQKQEPYAWRKFPSVEARKRYARYVAARYSAYDVYFIVAGEWHAETHTRPASEDEVRREFIEIGNVLRDADPHGRMVAIHPMAGHGSVREFNEAAWMSFADYQQNYTDLHARILQSRKFNKPVVNSEYGYLFRDQSGDGIPDKDNSTSVDVIRHATWDIVMAGGYVVTGFGTTYFGGNRDPGPFDVTTEKNRPWEAQMGHMKKLFEELEWWKLKPHDELVQSGTPRGKDRSYLKVTAPPETTYWCFAEPGKQYVVYARGLRESVTLDAKEAGLEARRYDPRSGEWGKAAVVRKASAIEFTPPDEQDWVWVVSE